MNYQVMPPLSGEEYSELKSDIQKRGVMVPIEFDEDGNVLDGHHRLKICEELGITDYPKIVRNGMSEEQKRTHARKLNMARRHLNSEQKRELIREQLRETPERSDRQIATGLGVSDKTVGSQRKEMERTAEIPQLSTNIGADGKERPRQVERKQPEPVVLEEPVVDKNKGHVNLDDVAAGLVTQHLHYGQYAEPNGDGTFNIYDHDDTYCATIGERSEGVGGVELDTAEPDWINPDIPEAKVEREVPRIEPAKKPHVVNNSTDNEWYTPAEYIEAAREAMGSIDLDPASNDFANKTVKAGTYYTEETDGLSKEWFGNIWLNPPYQTSLIGRFADKLNESNFNQAIVLVNNASETQWFQKMAEKATAFVWHLGRIRFEKRDGAHGVPLQGQIFLYFGNNPDGFLKVFTKYGRGSALDEKLSE